jgi:hypothetical protein
MGMVFDLLFGRKISVSITPQDVIDHFHEGLHLSISDTVENKINLRWFEFGRQIYSSTSAFKTKFKSPLVYRNNLNAVYPEVFEINEGMHLVEWVKEEHLPHFQDIPFGRCIIVIDYREFVLTLMKYLINNFGNREITFEF